MNKKIVEQVTLLASVVKWSCYASIVGGLVGVGTAAFLRSLAWSSGQFGRIPDYYLLLPLTLMVCSMLVSALAPDAAGHGTEKVIEAVHQRMGKIPLMVVPVKLVATVLTLAGGGSAGKEGPCAQIGAGLASGFASLLRLNDVDRRSWLSAASAPASPPCSAPRSPGRSSASRCLCWGGCSTTCSSPLS